MILALAVLVELIAAARAAARMLRTRGGSPIVHALRQGFERPQPDIALGEIAVVVPVLNEELRLGPALSALRGCGAEVAEIVVVDGGSTDGTGAIVEIARAADPRFRRVDAAPTPRDWNGKAWNLDVGLRATSAPWIAFIDADVRIAPTLLADALERARCENLGALSIATRQELPDAVSALLHPALLATLVYRYGLPNVASDDPARVVANGQVFIARRDVLERTQALVAARASRNEDVTVARIIAASGERFGFYEGDAVVRMHESWRECVTNWPRSLALRDAFLSRAQSWRALAELFFAQAAPLPTLIALLLSRRRRGARFVRAAALGAFAMRLGILAGTRRAYVRPSMLYWLSPLADVPALALIALAALRGRHVWRGRTLVDETP